MDWVKSFHRTVGHRMKGGGVMLTIPGPVILDLNTQRDLISPEGVYPVFQAEKLAEPLKKLFTFAHQLHIPVISTRLHHLTAPGQRGNNRVVCVPSTPGYQKMSFTTLRRRTEWPLDCGTSLPVDGFRTSRQFIFDLPNLNLFECPRLDRLLSESTAEIFLICGAPLEWSVRTAVLGLLARRHKVGVISDCIGMWDPYEGDMALRQIESKNIDWLTAEQAAAKYAPAARSRASREERARARATQGNVPVIGSPSKSRGAFRV
jgi:nicotinamidase-related amidase